jgi:hypothetical protein
MSCTRASADVRLLIAHTVWLRAARRAVFLVARALLCVELILKFAGLNVGAVLGRHVVLILFVLAGHVGRNRC